MGSDRSAQAGDRRDFLRRIARDGVDSAGALLGAVGAVRSEAEALSSQVRHTIDGVAPGGVQPPRRRASEASLDLPADAGLVDLGSEAPDPAYAAPVRDEADAVIVLDVRALPAQILERRADSAAALAALLAVDAMAPGPIRGLAAALGLALAEPGDSTARPARLQAAAAALRNADPLNDALDVEIVAGLAAAGPLAPVVEARAAARRVAHAAAADRLIEVLDGISEPIATGPGLGATAWGDLAPAHEALRRRGAASLLVATGPTVDPSGATCLGALDAADALRAGLDSELLGEGELGARIATGGVGALLLSAVARAEDGSVVVPAGGAGLAALARFAAIPLVLVATPMRERPAGSAAELAARVSAYAAVRARRPAAARGVSRGTRIVAPRVDLLDAAALGRPGRTGARTTVVVVG